MVDIQFLTKVLHQPISDNEIQNLTIWMLSLNPTQVYDILSQALLENKGVIAGCAYRVTVMWN